MNWLDKAVAAVSPQAGLRRVAARTRLEAFDKIRAHLGYDAAIPSRATNSWLRTGSSGNAEAGASLKALRDGSRELERNEPLATNGLEIYETRVVGTGIRPQARTGSADANTVLDEAFEQWSTQCTSSGYPDYYGLQGVGLRTIVRDGECILRHRQRRPGDGPFVTIRGRQFELPYQIQLLEPDYLDHTKTETTSNGYIVQGVQFDQLDHRVGYWLHASHPGDVVNTGWQLRQPWESAFVPASEVSHGRRLIRHGQVRGITAFAPVIVALHQMKSFEEAEQARKLIEACLAAFVIEPDEGDGATLGVTTTDSRGNKIESFEPGMIAYVKNGKNVVLSEPKAAGGYSDYTKSRHRYIAAGLHIPYELLLGNFEHNYSASRMGLVTFKSVVERWQWIVAIPFFGDPVWNRFVDTCVIAGLVSRNTPNLYGHEWGPPAFDLLDREAEADADLKEVRNGSMTFGQMVSRRGYDPKKQLGEIEQWNAAFDEAGVSLDIDPRRATRTGNAVTAVADQPQ